MKGARIAAPVLLVGLVAAVSLSAASIFYEIDAGGHAGKQIEPLAVATDSLGGLLAVLVALQLMLAYGFFPAVARQRQLHAAVAWPLVGAAALHGGGGILHSLEPPVEILPLVLIALGVAVTGVLVWQSAEGGAARAALGRHTVLGLAVGAGILAHVLIGAYHGITG